MFASLKIYHRCNFWGREIQGRHSERNQGINERVLHTQVVIENHHEFFGCCFSHGKRVSELKEHHLLKQHDGVWHLFLIERNISKKTGAYHMNFCLIPDNVYPNPLWKFEGIIHPNTMRMELSRHFYPILFTNKPYGYPRNHVHLMIVMDKAVCPHLNGWTSQPCPSQERKALHEQQRKLQMDRLVAVASKNSCDGEVVELIDENEAVPQGSSHQERNLQRQDEHATLPDFVVAALHEKGLKNNKVLDVNVQKIAEP